ncbi:MAG: MFS transporter [Betaproteobacteria bacterium TMED156]|nr:MAG: MFS transporter [Betaproteobacteria bacterium TMED156]
MSNYQYFNWTQIFRLGIVQMSIGGVVVLTTSTLNRVMVVELLLPALLPGILVAMHYAVQIIRPRMGFGSDKTGKCTPWIIIGIAVLCLGGVTSTFATVLMYSSPKLGVAIAILGFLMIGVGVSAAGTALLTLLAKKVDPKKRASAATLVWLMMISGFAITAGISGQFLDPFSPERLLIIASIISITSFLLTFLALWNIENKNNKHNLEPPKIGDKRLQHNNFFALLKEIWSEKTAKHFTVFVFISMLAFSMQDLILEPFAGIVFNMTPGQTTSLSGIQHTGVLIGMLLVAGLSSLQLLGKQFGSLKAWIVGGCLFSAVALFGLVLGGINGKGWFIELNVFILGVANGSFSIAAIASMMQLANEGKSKTQGTRIGLWGAAQAIAFGSGGFLGAIFSDIARAFVSNIGFAYAIVFFAECILFVIAAKIAFNIDLSKTYLNNHNNKTNIIISRSGSTT